MRVRGKRDELAKEITDLARHLASDDPAVTPEKVERLAILLHDKLNHGPAEFRQAYARLVLREVSVKGSEIGISGSKALLARTAVDGLEDIPPAVLSFVREWRARLDSNQRPAA